MVCVDTNSRKGAERSPDLCQEEYQSQRIREEIKRVFHDGVGGKVDGVCTLLRLGARRVAQELLEDEVTDFLDAERYVRHRRDQPHRGYRNGYKPSRDDAVNPHASGIASGAKNGCSAICWTRKCQ